MDGAADTNRALSPSTDDGYRRFCSAVGLTPDTVTLDDGTRGHWIGDRSAEKVLVFFHGKHRPETLKLNPTHGLMMIGGGYAMCAVDGHFKLVWNVIQEAKRNGQNLSVLFLSYGNTCSTLQR